MPAATKHVFFFVVMRCSFVAFAAFVAVAHRLSGGAYSERPPPGHPGA
jgi:hypothetical protein